MGYGRLTREHRVRSVADDEELSFMIGGDGGPVEQRPLLHLLCFPGTVSTTPQQDRAAQDRAIPEHSDDRWVEIGVAVQEGRGVHGRLPVLCPLSLIRRDAQDTHPRAGPRRRCRTCPRSCAPRS